MKVFA